MSTSDKIAIVAATRTAIGSFMGSLAAIPASELGTVVMRALLEKTGLDPSLVSEVIMGQVLTGGAGQNPARQAAVNAGIPYPTPALTINKVCGSGLKAVMLGAQAIRLGDADIVVAGGMENMSLAPHVNPASRTGIPLGHGKLIDTMISDGLWDAFNDVHMGVTAENLAKRHGISREEQDEYALQSQQRAAAAIAADRFAAEITPVMVPQRKGDPVKFDQDEQPRTETNIESLAKLRPAFDKHGTVTAGNASTLNDAAAAVILMRVERAQELELPVLAKIEAYASAGVEPAYMGEGPIPASHLCLQKADWTIASVDRIEANEAFAVQALTVAKQLEFDLGKVNVNGGAIALGHPIGASGCRTLVTLIHELQRADLQRGLVTLCIGGGQGVAMAVSRP